MSAMPDFADHVLEHRVPLVAEQMAARVGADDEQVEPAIVVEVGDGRVDGARRERERRLVGDVLRPPALDEVEPRHEPPLGRATRRRRRGRRRRRR